MFVCTIATGFISIVGGHSLGLTGVVTAIVIALVYITLTVHAIDNDEQAVKLSYIIIAAYIISLITSFTTLKDSPDFVGSMTNDIFNGNSPTSSIENWVVENAVNNAPYTLVMNILMIVVWGLGLKHINKRYMLAWIMGMASQIVACFGTFFQFDPNTFDVYSKCNNISAVIAFIFLIALLTINDKKETPNKKPEVKTVAPQEPVSVEQPNTLNKTEQLFKLKELLDSGILTQNEFDSEKKKILNS